MLCNKWKECLKTPLPDRVTHTYQGTTVILSKDTVSFMLSKVYEAGNKEIKDIRKKYMYAVREMKKYHFPDWQDVKKINKRDLVGSLVTTLAPGVRRNA